MIIIPQKSSAAVLTVTLSQRHSSIICLLKIELISNVSQYQTVSVVDFIGAKDDGDGNDNSWSYKTCKALVTSVFSQISNMSPPTNQHPVFLQAGCPSWRPTNSVKALKEDCRKKTTKTKYKKNKLIKLSNWTAPCKNRTSRYISFFLPITRSCPISDVLLTGGRGMSDFSVLKYY